VPLEPSRIGGIHGPWSCLLKTDKVRRAIPERTPMEPTQDTTDLVEITVEVSTALLSAAQKETAKGIAETVIEGLEKLLSETP